MKNFVNIFLLTLSILTTGCFVIGYILWKLFSVELFSKLFQFPDGQTFYLIFLSFLVLCNLPLLRGVIQGIIRDKVSEQTIVELIPTIKEKIQEDKLFLKESIDNYNRDQTDKKFVDEKLINK